MPPSVYAACPSTRDFSAQYVESLWLTRYHGRLGWTPIVGQDIATARNLICERFLKSGFDYLLMHDSDATWHPEAISRLVSHAAPVVTGIIFMRRLPPVPSIGEKVGGATVEGAQMYSFKKTVERIQQMDRTGAFRNETRNEILLPELNSLEKIDGAGAHFMLIRRDVIEKIRAPWYVPSALNAGEDFDFCRRVQKAGFELYADWSVFTGHVAGPGITLGVREFLMCWRGAQADEEAGKWKA